MTEKDMWKALKTAWSKLNAHATRIENTVTSGCPDVFVTYQSNEEWFELKVHKRLIPFRPSQLAWMQRRQQAGKDTLIVTCDGNRNWRVYSFTRAKNDVAFIMHLNKPHINTEQTKALHMVVRAQDLLNFV